MDATTDPITSNVSMATVSESGWCSPHPRAMPELLPPPGSPERWPWLQQLRRRPSLDLEPWLVAIESGGLQPEADLLAVLAERVDGQATVRLLAWWLAEPSADPECLSVIARLRHPGCAGLLRQALATASPARQELLVPLLGHQRDPADFSRLRSLVLEPGPLPLRRAALEGLALGLPAWPSESLRQLLRSCAVDLDPVLAGAAVDLLARLPHGRRSLSRLNPTRLDGAVARRRQRRLDGLRRSALLLVVHGRRGGVIPEELRTLAREVERLRGTPVHLHALTADPGPAPGDGGELTLVPLFLLPGTHVRHDLAAVAAQWRGRGAVGRVPFLGAWPCWQEALREELTELAGSAAVGSSPWLIHHPMDGRLGSRYLRYLERSLGVRCRPAVADGQEPLPAMEDGAPVLPLVLAANRLTESLPQWLGPPLLQRFRFRQLLLTQLEALP